MMSMGGKGSMSMGGPGGFGAGGAGGVGGPGGSPDGDFEKTDAAKVMVRMLDFTVEPEKTYRYRIRIVVRNPNFGWEMVALGTDTKEEEKMGPWSEPSEAANVPADVAAYAWGPPSCPATRDVVKFQVVRFQPEDGLTIVKTFDAAPGDIVGGTSNASVPRFTEKDVKRESKPIDFTSHQVVIGSEGGREPLAVLNLTGAPLDDPARAVRDAIRRHACAPRSSATFSTARWPRRSRSMTSSWNRSVPLGRRRNAKAPAWAWPEGAAWVEEEPGWAGCPGCPGCALTAVESRCVENRRPSAALAVGRRCF